MPNWIDDNLDLANFPKADNTSGATGKVAAIDMNGVRDALRDTQSFLRGALKVFKAADPTKFAHIDVATASPNGSTTGTKGSVIIDVQNAKIWQNTTGGTVWADVTAGGGGGGGGITNSAGSNVVPKSDGTNIVASQITDTGSLITLPGAVSTGGINSQELINGPTLQSLVIPNTSYGFGEINRIEVSGVVPAWPADTFSLVIRNSCTADCTTHTQRSGAAAFEVTGTRTAGSNEMFNVALETLASGAQNNYAFEALDGDVNIDSGNLDVTGTGFFTGFLATTGVLFAEGNGAQGLFLSGTPTNNIYSTDPSTVFNVHNASNSTLEFMNDGGGTLTLAVDGDIRVGSPTGPRILSGTGSPAGVVAAPVGSLYMRTDGSTSTTMYVKETGTTTSSGWVAK